MHSAWCPQNTRAAAATGAAARELVFYTSALFIFFFFFCSFPVRRACDMGTYFMYRGYTVAVWHYFVVLARPIFWPCTLLLYLYIHLRRYTNNIIHTFYISRSDSCRHHIHNTGYLYK